MFPGFRGRAPQRSCRLIRGFVIARVAAGFTVHEAVGADSNVELRLAKAAELFTLALVFRLFTLVAAVLAETCFGRHAIHVSASFPVQECADSNHRRVDVSYGVQGLEFLCAI